MNVKQFFFSIYQLWEICPGQLIINCTYQSNNYGKTYYIMICTEEHKTIYCRLWLFFKKSTLVCIPLSFIIKFKYLLIFVDFIFTKIHNPHFFFNIMQSIVVFCQSEYRSKLENDIFLADLYIIYLFIYSFLFHIYKLIIKT